MAESFVFYQSFREAIRHLPEKDRLEALEGIIDYALYGEYPIPESNVALAIITMAIPQIDANNKRRDDGKKGGRPSKKPMDSESTSTEKPMVLKNAENKKPVVFNSASTEKPVVMKMTSTEKPNVNVNDNVNVNVNVNDNENIKGGYRGEKRTRFIPPSLQEVTAYCRERKNHVDPEAFVNFYESKGWKVGKDPMKDWKASVRTWEQREKREKKPPNSFHNFEQREDIDFDDIERRLREGWGQ